MHWPVRHLSDSTGGELPSASAAERALDRFGREVTLQLDAAFGVRLEL